MERIVHQANMKTAWKNVKANRGAPGPDGVTLDEFFATFRHHWPEIRRQLLDGTYQPGPARRKSIPKPGWRSAKSRNSERDRPPDPTSHPASPRADFRPRILGVELRLPTKTSRSRCSEAGTILHPRRLSPMRRYGPLEVFRPRPARRADGAGVP
jgi:hypothetical protein